MATVAAQAITIAGKATEIAGEAIAIQIDVTKNHAACQKQNRKIFTAPVIFRKLLSGSKLRKRHWLNRRFAAWLGEKIPASSAADPSQVLRGVRKKWRCLRSPEFVHV
jgi:hypothetical protein